MDLIINIEDNIHEIFFSGNLDTNTAPDAELKVNELIESGVDKIIFNLEKTDYVSSSGLRIFLSTAKKTASKGGKLVLCSPNEVVNEILEISGFNTIITVKDSKDEALEEF